MPSEESKGVITRRELLVKQKSRAVEIRSKIKQGNMSARNLNVREGTGRNRDRKKYN